jgi:hypothetical protein
MSQPGPNKIFLSVCGPDQALFRSDLASVLNRAGLVVLPAENTFSADEIRNSLREAECSVHLLFPQYGPVLENITGMSLAKFQFAEAKKQLDTRPDFKMVIWMPPSTSADAIEPAQMDFINEVRNNLSKNMVFSNSASPLRLTDDLRSMLEKKEEVIFNVNATDIFLISNELDEGDAAGIIEMLSDIVPVEKLTIVQDSDMDYSEFCSQQIGKSKLAVVYFKESGDWALPFAQQVWKKIGGASSHTPILLIGDEDPETNMNKKFKAPKVISLIVAGELIPLEIKVNFDKVIEGKVT